MNATRNGPRDRVHQYEYLRSEIQAHAETSLARTTPTLPHRTLPVAFDNAEIKAATDLAK